jgi:hypothetical protein
MREKLEVDRHIHSSTNVEIQGMIIADARIFDFWIVPYQRSRCSGFEFETVRYYGHSPTRVSEEEEIKILQARREAVKMAADGTF